MIEKQSFKIRNAVRSDLTRLKALEDEAFKGERLSRRQLRYHINNPHARLLIALSDDNEIAGYALVFFRGKTLARLYSLAVGARFLGRGLGSILVQTACRAAAERGARCIILEVRNDNYAAIGLYEKAGFKKGKILRAYYDEDGADALKMILSL